MLAKLPANRVLGLEPSHKFWPDLKALEVSSGGRFQLVKGNIIKLDLEDGCPPSHELFQDIAPSPWEADG